MGVEKTKIEYANWWSKLIFGQAYEDQFVIPVPSPRPLVAAMEFSERVFFNKNWDSIEIDRPVFIVGLPRSGTSLLYNLLSAADEAAYVTTSINSFPTAPCTIEWARKKFNFNIRGERFLQDSIDADFSSPSEPALFWGKWIGRDATSLYWAPKRLKDFSPEKIHEIHQDVRKILYCFGGMDAASKRRFVTKYPVFQTELEMIQDLFPDAHFIHIIRDGRQVANSLVKLNKLVNDQIKKIKHPEITNLVPYPRIEKLKGYIDTYGVDTIDCTARVWQDSIETVNQVKGNLNKFTEIRYEDLLKNPKAELAKLFDFIGFNWPSEGNALFKREFSNIGVLRHSNRYGDFDRIEAIVGPMLKAYGYT